MITRILDQSLAEGFLRSFETYEITHAWQGSGTSIFLELGTLTQDKRHNSNGEMGFSFEWSWRIENRHSILLGTFSEDEDISKAISILKGKKIIKAELFGRLKEIQLQLDGDIWFSSFATSEGDPEWGARNRSNEWLYFRQGKFLIESDT